MHAELADEAAVREAFPFAERETRSGSVVVETFIPGKDYRILVVNNQIVAVAERVGPILGFELGQMFAPFGRICKYNPPPSFKR